jgi:hypothetical protein
VAEPFVAVRFDANAKTATRSIAPGTGAALLRPYLARFLRIAAIAKTHVPYYSCYERKGQVSLSIANKPR